MTRLENQSQKLGSISSTETKQPYRGLISRDGLLRRLFRSKEARARFVESHLNKTLAFQIRSLREAENWTQAEFANELGMAANNVSARLENQDYGKHTLSTLKKIAAACDVGLVVWFVPFGRLIDWATCTPHTDYGLTPHFYDVPSFTKEFETLDKF